MSELRAIARQLGGDVAGRNSVNCPGPGHSKGDRSLSVTFTSGAPGGFIAHSFAGDNWQDCRDYVAVQLGISFSKGAKGRPPGIFGSKQLEPSPDALKLWGETHELVGTLAEYYLVSRGLIGLQWVNDVRFHPHCPFGPGQRHPCMVALYRDIITDAPKAIHRTALTADGKKVDRRALGPKGGCAIKLSDNADITKSLLIGEGIETVLAGAALFHRPVWALGDAGEIERFTILPAVETLTILVDHDIAGKEAAHKCSQRWTRAGREVFRAVPTKEGDDFADLLEALA